MPYGMQTPPDQRDSCLEFQDGFFRKLDDEGLPCVVDAPNMPRPVPDMLSSVQRLNDPVLSLARAGANNVSIACLAVDLFDEAQATLDKFRDWHIRSSILVRHLGKGNC